MRTKIPSEVLDECRFICKGYARRRRELANKLASLGEGITPADEWADAELLKLMAVRHAMSGYDPQTAKALLTNIEEGIPYEHLCVPMGRQMFYRERRRFLEQIAGYMGY